MSIEPYTGFLIRCDSCGEGDMFSSDGISEVVTQTEKEARELIKDSEGEVDADGRVRCFGCVEGQSDE